MPDFNDDAAYFENFGPVNKMARTKFQKIVARRMSENATGVPHVTHHDELDVTKLEERRLAQSRDEPASPLIYVIKAVVEAMTEYPHFNASLSVDGETLILKEYFHIGVAVDGPLGLLVPVLHDCDKKDVPTLAQDLKDLTALARTKGLPLEKMSGGCLSISSLGGIGGHYFTPIINVPEVAILGVTNIITRPVWDGEVFQAKLMLPVSLSYDHRVINGADAARFVNHIGQVLAR